MATTLMNGGPGRTRTSDQWIMRALVPSNLLLKIRILKQSTKIENFDLSYNDEII